MFDIASRFSLRCLQKGYVLLVSMSSLPQSVLQLLRVSDARQERFQKSKHQLFVSAAIHV